MRSAVSRCAPGCREPSRSAQSSSAAAFHSRAEADSRHAVADLAVGSEQPVGLVVASLVEQIEFLRRSLRRERVGIVDAARAAVLGHDARSSTAGAPAMAG